MNALPSNLVRFKWGALAVTAITFLSLMPQLNFWLVRGSQWQGAYIVLQPDEVLYSAYVNSLIDGRPRRNDPTTGQDDHPEAPLPESLFSIQYIPPFIIAGLARAAGASASSAFIALMGFAGLFASLSVFWLLSSITGDNRLAALGVLVVLSFGGLVAGHGLVGLLLNRERLTLGLPFLRRYQPAASFYLFFVFCTLIWQAITTESKRRAILKALLAGVTLGLLIFSYFYLWTAAVAWFVCVGCLWLLLRPVNRRGTTRVLIITTAPVILALAVYAYLLSHLPPALDRAWVQTLTHRTDLLRVPEILGALILLALIVRLWQGKISFREPQVIFAISFALLPFLVFNQQVISGRSIQPFHYELLIANYVVLVALVMIVRFLQPAIPRRTMLLLMSSCFLWGTIEVSLSFLANYRLAVGNEDMVPVLLRLKEQAKHDGTLEGLHEHGRTPALVFSPQYGISTILPTWAPQGSLLAPGNVSFQSLSGIDRKEWLFMHFYYCGRDLVYLRELLNDRTNDPFLTHYARTAIFGAERVVDFLGSDFQPIRQDEIEHEAREYEAFAKSFSHEKAIKRPLTYAITLTDSRFDFSHIDLWYERDAGARVGTYTLYRLKLRE